ncbi:MAG: hypothetical protein K9L61_00585 [Candidatus Omnitrophica bacterium]|nr:hypothetical protein [Candidatus Omnitrophota bacterium]
MFSYLEQIKGSYHKGQLAPFFIAFLVVLVIVTLVIVNVGKVSLVKTHSSNSADAGALAGGSSMALVFNGLCIANAQMIVQFQYFFLLASLLFVIALIYLTMALIHTIAAKAAGITSLIVITPCVGCAAIGSGLLAMEEAAAAIESIGSFSQIITSIMVATAAYWFGAWYAYKQIRDNVDDGVISSREAALALAFANSGIQLPQPGEEVGENWNKNTDDFDSFMDGLSGSSATFSWTDGQARDHSVSANVSIDEVVDYHLKVTFMPFIPEMALFATILVMAYVISAKLTAALTSYTIATLLSMVACPLGCCCLVYPCSIAGCPAFYAVAIPAKGLFASGNGLALTAKILEIIEYPLVVLAWGGLIPARVVTSSSKNDIWPEIICWIDDKDDNDDNDGVTHNRKVSVSSTQNHEGVDVGIYETEYPSVSSWSRVYFRGKGEIYPPSDGGHDPVIEATD